MLATAMFKNYFIVYPRRRNAKEVTRNPAAAAALVLIRMKDQDKRPFK